MIIPNATGLFAGLALDGTILVERYDANRDFYGSNVSTTDILKYVGLFRRDRQKLLRIGQELTGTVDVFLRPRSPRPCTTSLKVRYS